jgi:hypothetical protein
LTNKAIVEKVAQTKDMNETSGKFNANLNNIPRELLTLKKPL